MLDLQILLTVVVAGTWWALYRPLLAQSYYRWWAWGWTVFLVFLVGVRLSFSGALPPMVATLLHSPAGLLQVACFAIGAETLRRGEDLRPSTSRMWLGIAAVLGTALGISQFSIENETVSVIARTLIRSPGLALALAYCGWQFLKQRDRAPTAGIWITAGGFFLYAFDQLVYSVGAVYQAGALLVGVGPGQLGEPLALWTAFTLADMAWEAAIGGGAILLLVEEKDELYRESRRNERRFQALFEQSVDGILMADGSARIRDVNPAALEMLGFGRSELVGRSLYDLVTDDSSGDLPPPEEVEERGGLTLETTCRAKSGETFPVELSLSAYVIDDQRRLQGIMRDISTRQALMERLTHRATHDPLTDLPNRHYLNDELERMLAMMRRGEAQPAVLFLDLDEFKQVNDVHGHAAGDALLVEVAGRLLECVRQTELVGHLGGDEFVVLVPWCPSADVLRQLGERIAESLGSPYRMEGHSVRISTSIGGALARATDTEDSLLNRADQAMYRVKERAEGGSKVLVRSTA